MEFVSTLPPAFSAVTTIATRVLAMAASGIALLVLATPTSSRAAAEVLVIAAHAVVMAASGYPDLYTKGEIINLPIEEADSKIFHAGTKLDKQHIISNGGRVLCATALGADIKEAQDKAYQLINKVKWSGSYYRTDIGFKGI